jgi:hypothetical protein
MTALRQIEGHLRHALILRNVIGNGSVPLFRQQLQQRQPPWLNGRLTRIWRLSPMRFLSDSGISAKSFEPTDSLDEFFSEHLVFRPLKGLRSRKDLERVKSAKRTRPTCTEKKAKVLQPSTV